MLKKILFRLFISNIGLAATIILAGCGQSAPAPHLSSEITGQEAADPADLRHEYGLDKPWISKLFSGDLFKGGDPALFMYNTNSLSDSDKTSTTTTDTGARGIDAANYSGQVTLRMIVRTGNIEIVVDNISGALSSIKQIAGTYDGYVVTFQQWREGDRNIGTISIRVAAAAYENAMQDLRSIAKSITRETSSSQDVTEEYTDLGSQLVNLQVTETQLQKIMEAAAKTDDILAIQRELTDVRGKIEQIKGRMVYLERTSATSLIEIKLEEAVLGVKFSAEKISARAAEKVLFTAEISGGFAPYSYFWDFGDGTTSFEKNPRHSYKNPGTYPVGLKVTDDKGYTNTSIRENYINVVSNWQPGGVFRNAWSGFVTFGKGFVNVIIWLLAFSPAWIAVAAVVWYFVFYRRNKRRNRN